MSNLNLINILYLFFRLAPFVLVCFFVMDSVLNSNIRGFVLLTGLLVACFIANLIGGVLPVTEVNPVDLQARYNCNMLTLGEDGPISAIPLAQTVFGYIIGYLGTILVHMGILLSNIHVIVMFIIIIIADMSWNLAYGCVGPARIVGALMIGLLFGILYATGITVLNYTDLYYVAGVSTNEVCSMPTTRKFVCTPN